VTSAYCSCTGILFATDPRVLRTKYVYIKSTTVYVPSSELGRSQPLSRQRVCPSPQNRAGGGLSRVSPAGEGMGEFKFRRLEKKLSTLSTLWYCTCIASPLPVFSYDRDSAVIGVIRQLLPRWPGIYARGVKAWVVQLVHRVGRGVERLDSRRGQEFVTD
jgi:hypothetical protein